MQVLPVQTEAVGVGGNIYAILDQYLPPLHDNDIVVITSKIISLCQGNVVPKKDIPSKYDLICDEADLILQTDHNPYDLYLTIKDGILIPSAGIDESNAKDMYILYPKNVQKAACDLWHYLRQKHNIENLGLVITDSHTTIMRQGVTGIALGWCGFDPLYSYVGKPDIHGVPLKVTHINILDALATSAVFVMGEGDEKTPLALIKNAPKISFLQRTPTPDEEKRIHISMEDDLYSPLLKASPWIKTKTQGKI